MKPTSWELNHRAESLNDAIQRQAVEYLDEFEETILAITTSLKKRNHTSEETAFQTNHAKAWITNLGDKREGLMIENSSRDESTFLYTFNQNRKALAVNCYRIYVDWHNDLERHDYKHFIRFTDIYSDYTDNYEGNQTVTKPNLAFFKENLEKIESEEGCAFAKPLFIIAKTKKTMLQKLLGNEMFDDYLEMTAIKPKEREGYLIAYEVPNAPYHMKEIYSVCNATCEIWEILSEEKE